MKRLNVFLYFLSAFIATGTLLFFIVFPLHLFQSVWKDYRILAAPASADIEAYINVAEQAGISGIVSELSVSNRFSVLGGGRYGRLPFTDPESYGRWFKDTGSSFRYFYIPYTSLFQFIKLYFFLYRAKIPFYLESAFPYAPLKAFFAFVLFFYCIIGSRKKTLFFSASFSFLCYALCVKSSLALTTALLSILTVAYWLEALDNEVAIPWKQLKERIQCNVFMLILPAVPLVISILDGLFPFLFFLLALLLSASAVFSVYSFLQLKEMYQAQYRQHPSLKIFVMHPQSWAQFWNTRYAITVTVLTACLLSLSALLSLCFPMNRLAHSIAVIDVPQPVTQPPAPYNERGFFAAQLSRPQGALPDLGSYIEDYWYTAAQLYLNVHDPVPPVSLHAQIRFDFFTEDSTGKLHREEKILYTFDSLFILRALQDERLALLPLEKMLIAQSGFTAAVHRPLKLFTRGVFVSFFITLGTLLFPCILIIMAKLR